MATDEHRGLTPDPEFPLYRVVYHFTVDGAEEFTTLMDPWLYAVDPGEDVVRVAAEAKWSKINWHGEPKNRTLVRIDVKRKPDTPWALAWFAHKSIRAGRTDAELRDSFDRYVSRYEHLRERHDDPEYVCLMGAEDRWRWKDPCACETCVKNDWAVITH